MDSQAITLKKMLLNATLLANLDTLKVHLPSLYTFFQNYSPKSAGVVIDDCGNLDLYHNEEYIYKGRAEILAKLQVFEFLKSPLYFDLQLEEISDNVIFYEHQSVLNRINNRRKSDINYKVDIHDHDDRLDLVCMLGGGLGFQITELFSLRKIKHFQLYEPSEDIFYAMMHCIELRPIFESCIDNGGRFNISVGNNDVTFMNNLNKLFHSYGHFNVPNFYIYKHYESKTNDATIDLLKKMGYRFAFGFGFMEDEIIGFNHTLANLKRGYKLLKKDFLFENQKPDIPIFVVGSGPSLDYSLDFLQKNSENIIIISCGTALRSLLKNNIKPDIHIEMERPVEMLPIMEEVAKQQENSELKLKDIQIVALNTVYPKLLELFKSPLIFRKHTDVGGTLIEQLDVLNLYASPSHSNPTCTNSGMVIATSLGFKKIYMLGTDFGYVSQKHHHSKDSVYYDETAKGINPEIDEIDDAMNEKLQRKGNFRDLVFTNEIFDASRMGVEMVLAKYKDVNVFNCSDGALISGVTPLRIEDISLPEILKNKEDYLDNLLVSAFDNKGYTLRDIEVKVDDSFHVLKVTMEQLMLMFNTQITTKEELSDVFFKQHALLKTLQKRKEHKLNYIFLQGSFKYLQTFIMTNCYYYTKPNEQEEFIQFCVEEFKQHIDYLLKKLINSRGDG